MDEAWRRAPLAALGVQRTGERLEIEPNEAALAWGGPRGIGAADWQAGAEQAMRARGRAADIELGPGADRVRATVVEAGDRAVIWLQPSSTVGAHPDPAVLDDALALVQDFGRLGLFVRDADSGRGWWSPQVFQLFGLEPSPDTPDFGDAARRVVHPDDLPILLEYHASAGARPGRGSVRYRIVRPDGGVRHIHSLHDVRQVGSAARVVGVLIDDTEATERVEAERRAAAYLDRALQLAGVSVWRIDLAAQRVHFNALGFDLLGKRADPAGIPLEEMRQIIHPDDRASVVAAADTAIAGDRTVDVVARYRNRVGSWRTLLTRRVVDRDAEGRVSALAGVSLDLTDQIAVRERAEALAAHARLVADAIGLGFWSYDMESGRVVWDDQLYRIHRRDPSREPPSPRDWIRELVHPHDQRWLLETYRRDDAHWAPATDATVRLADRGDGERWVQMWTRRMVRDGSRVAYGIHLDVTERQRQQAQQRRERERLQFALDAAEVGIWERSLDGTVLHWSEGMYRLRGLDPSDPRPAAELMASTMDPEDHRRLREIAFRHADEGRAYRWEYRVRWPDGQVRWLASQGHAIRDAHGRVVALAGVNFDITERRRADELQQQKQLAEQASRDKSEFMARMSHELRTPLNAILGFAQLLEDDPEEPPTSRQRSRLQRIRTAGEHLLTLIDAVLDLAEVDSERVPVACEAVDLGALLHEMAAAVAPLARRLGIEMQVGAGDPSPWVRADRRRLAQSLRALLAVTLRQARSGGRLRLSVRSDADRDATIELRVEAAPDQAWLFEPAADDANGQTADAAALRMARHVIEAMGGMLATAPAPAGGVDLVLPLAGGPSNVMPVQREPSPRRRTVLCIEDEPVNLTIVRELLATRPQWRLIEATDGITGLARATEETPDIVLLDLHLPDMDGVEVLRRMRADPALAGCRIAALTANAMPADAHAAIAAGFDDYWTKPIDFDRFLAGLERLAGVSASG